MIIHQEICVGCGRCIPYCPTGAIRREGLKSFIDQDVCYECSTCLRAAHCPVDAIAESPDVFEYPRALRRYFSDPSATHAATGIQGRGTEESKTNDVTRRCGPTQVGICIEVGRPNLGMAVSDIQKITRAIARGGIHKIEANNPIHSMIADETTGDMKLEMLGERILSAIIELQVERHQVRNVLRIVREVAKELDSVFTLDAFTVVGPNLQIPEDFLESIRAEGFAWRPNAKVNMGLGRAWE